MRFARNHAYTGNVTGNQGGRFDHERAFDPLRAQAMDSIWLVLRGPSAVTWSASNPGNKQFDKQLDFVNPRFGRVVLKPMPTKEDVVTGKVTSFEFVSWHAPDKAQYDATRKVAAHQRITPTEMKKAQSGDVAFLPSRTTIILPVSGASNEALPTLEGFPLQLTPSFKVRHNRNSFESDSLHESAPIIGDFGQFSKALPLDFSSSADLLKAGNMPPSGDDPLWSPHESPFIRWLIEQWTAKGMNRFGALQAELAQWLDFAQHKVGPALPKPAASEFAQWTPGELKLAKAYLEALPPEAFELSDWLLVSDYLFQRYCPLDVMRADAQLLAVRAAPTTVLDALAKIKAVMGTQVPQDALIARFRDVLNRQIEYRSS